MNQVYVGGILHNSLSNGLGTRFVIFFDGCNHRCAECQNQHLWSFKEEDLMDIDEVCNMIKNQVPLITGITLSGGDPFMQPEGASKIAKFAHSIGLDVWTYTGYTYKELEEQAITKDNFKALLDETDVIVDGRYDKDLKDDSLHYRGSSNQRIIYT